MDMWGKGTEEDFFRKSLKTNSPEKLFYETEAGKKYIAYWPKSYSGKKLTLQSRNSIIGNFTEKWSRELLDPIAKERGLYSINGVVSEQIELSTNSPADVALCETNGTQQQPESIKAIFEVKMSVVWNWSYKLMENETSLNCVGDYKTHTGNPGLLRSDSMLKAIGKAVGIRTASPLSAQIPIVILGNTPIQPSYYKKVDMLKRLGIIQGFWSVNPKPLDDSTRDMKTTEGFGFIRMDNYGELQDHVKELLSNDKEFFAGMEDREKLGKIIEIANQELTYESKALKFLEMLRS
jgi:hypothetical protein